MNQGVVADLIGRQVRKAAVPEQRRHLLPADPTLETRAILRPVEDQKPGGREALAVAPRCRLSLVRLGDEVLEIAFPTPVVVGEEDHRVAAGQSKPAGIVDRAHIQHETRAVPVGDQLGDPPQGDRECQTPEAAFLQRRNGDDMVLRIARSVFQRSDGLDLVQ